MTLAALAVDLNNKLVNCVKYMLGPLAPPDHCIDQWITYGCSEMVMLMRNSEQDEN